LSAIYVDLDDVISKTTCHYVKILEQEFGKKIDFENITSFNLKESFSLTDKEYEYFFEFVHRPEIILKLEPMEGAIDMLLKCSDYGYDISVVTGRLTSTYESSIEWLALHQVPYNYFIMVDKYSREGIDKDIAISLERLSKMDFIMAVEDSIEMALFLSQEMKTKVLLFDRPWNRALGCDSSIKRCVSWSEVDIFGI